MTDDPASSTPVWLILSFEEAMQEENICLRCLTYSSENRERELGAVGPTRAKRDPKGHWPNARFHLICGRCVIREAVVHAEGGEVPPERDWPLKAEHILREERRVLAYERLNGVCLVVCRTDDPKGWLELAEQVAPDRPHAGTRVFENLSHLQETDWRESQSDRPS